MTKSATFETALNTLLKNDTILNEDQIKAAREILALSTTTEDSINYSFDDGSVCSVFEKADGFIVSDISIYF